MLSSVDRCKSYMKKTPKNRWLAVWEPTVTEFTKELATVSAEEIRAFKPRKKHMKNLIKQHWSVIVVV